jgi:hypothetical protein
MTQNADVQGLQSKAEVRLASLKDEKLVTRIAVLSTSLEQSKTTQRLMIGISIETHKTSPDFDQKSATKAKSRIMQVLGDIDCDGFIEWIAKVALRSAQAKAGTVPARKASIRTFVGNERGAKEGRDCLQLD